MSLYIPGVPLRHSFPVKITVWPDGSFSEVADDVLLSCGKVIEVQPHGRLGDLDAIPMREQFKPFSELEQAYCDGLEFCRDLMPTIIPADGADKEEL